VEAAQLDFKTPGGFEVQLYQPKYLKVTGDCARFCGLDPKTIVTSESHR
jgi:hypothetical protein